MSTFDEEAFKAELIHRAVTDRAFRVALMMDPKGTVEAALGRVLPDELEVEIVQELPNKVILVLPLILNNKDTEPVDRALTDDELEQVSGGVSGDALRFQFDGTLNRALNRRRR
jgi:hypothetical protein